MVFRKLLKPTKKASMQYMFTAVLFYVSYVIRNVSITVLLASVVAALMKFETLFGIDNIDLLVASSLFTILFGYASSAIREVILDNFLVLGKEQATEMIAAIQTVFYRAGMLIRVQKNIEEAVVLFAGEADPDYVTIEWATDADGVKQETIYVPNCRKQRIRGGHLMTYRRILHDYPGLGVIQESEKLIFHDNEHTEYLVLRELVSSDWKRKQDRKKLLRVPSDIEYRYDY